MPTTTKTITKPMHELITTYVVLEVVHRFPIKEGPGPLCARRLWSHEEVMHVEPLAEATTLSAVIAKLEALP